MITESLTLYHGSSSIFLERILTEGLRPSDQTGIKSFDHIKTYLDKIWLTDKISCTQIMAEVGSVKKYGGNVIVAEVIVNPDDVQRHPFMINDFFHPGPLKTQQIFEYCAITGNRFPSYQLLRTHNLSQNQC